MVDSRASLPESHVAGGRPNGGWSEEVGAKTTPVFEPDSSQGRHGRREVSWPRVDSPGGRPSADGALLLVAFFFSPLGSL